MKNKFEVRGDTTAIFLTRKDGSVMECLIDTEDLDRVNGLRSSWHVKAHEQYDYYCAIGYHYRNSKTDYYVKLHHLITGFPLRDLVIDHVNGNPMDNRKSNLRIVTASQNQQNRKGAARHGKSGIRGVHWDVSHGKWKAQIVLNKKTMYLGLFSDPVEAGRVAAEARAKHMPYSKEARCGA